jgi:2-keto-4-pentenoate hydratase/2-oxohepta-3-ene-1,7-dioic acid hydratase in catechol pathway
MAVIFGRHCRNVSEHQALDFVGYTCFNDVSQRISRIATNQAGSGQIL